jgi:hypothetical protein
VDAARGGVTGRGAEVAGRETFAPGSVVSAQVKRHFPGFRADSEN